MRVIFFSSLIWLLIASPLHANSWAPLPHLTVEGQARLQLAADRLDIHASFSREHSDSRLAIQELESRFGNLQRTLRRQLPEGARLEAGQIRVTPRHRRQQDSWEVVGYTATRDLKLINLPVEQAGTWVERVVQGQPTQLGPLHYHSTQAASQQHPALEQALADARNKAEVMAASLGQRIGRALQVEEISRAGIQPRAAVMLAADSAERTPELDAGPVEASAQVRVVFELLLD